MLVNLPSDIQRVILHTVDEISDLSAISQVSKEFNRLSKETTAERIDIGLRFYKENGSEYEKARIVAARASGRLLQFVRVSMMAYRDGRLIESFARWTYLYEGHVPVMFSRQINRMKHVAWRMLTKEERNSMSLIFSLRTRQRIDSLKASGHYRPQLLMDLIVRYAYDTVTGS